MYVCEYRSILTQFHFAKTFLRRFWFCAGEELKQISEVAVKQNCSLWPALSIVTVVLLLRKK